MKNQLLENFEKYYKDNEGVRVFFAPGRVNLIGEHTDYNGGHVFPCALTIGTYAAVRKREDGKLRFISLNYENKGIIESSLESLKYSKDEFWTAYPKGVIWALKEQGYNIDKGMDMLIFGNIPGSSGLSSSASVEVLTAFAIKNLYNLEIDNSDIALISQYAENEYCGVKCGIMDQFAIAMGKKNHAIFLDTATLNYRYLPIKPEKAKFVIICTNKKRGLGNSKYNERRCECEEALSRLRSRLQINSLGELDEESLEKNKDCIGDEILYRRARHAVSENIRTVKAVEALLLNDMDYFGRLMNESHISLRDDYEVTGKELDAAVEAAWQQKGVIGARMTGAGFGGCAVSIVKEEYVNDFIKNVGEAYYDKIGYEASFYCVDVGDGPHEI